MILRTFDWRDFPTLYRYRRRSVFLDSSLLLTRGPQLIPGALFSSFMPSMGVFTMVSTADARGSNPMIGQAIHPIGSQFAHLTFIAPRSALESPALDVLVEALVKVTGGRGALRLLADVREGSLTFERFRQASFAIYTRQRIWRWADKAAPGNRKHGLWRAAVSRDAIPIRSLYNNLVPGMVQQIEPFSMEHPKGLVHYQDGELVGYVDLKYGHRGIWLQPFLHPDTRDVDDCLTTLFQAVPNRYGRALYLCVRSYQSWLEPAIEAQQGQAGPQQVVMVKHMAMMQKVARTYATPVLEGGQTEITTPIVQYEAGESPDFRLES